METLSSIFGDESLVTGDVVGAGLGGFLDYLGGTGLWQWAYDDLYMSFLVHWKKFLESMELFL